MLFCSNYYTTWNREQRAQIEEQLSILVNQHYRYCRKIFAALEQEGVFLGNGYFSVAVLQPGATPVLQETEMRRFGAALEACCRKMLRTSLYYAIGSNGCPHLILCYPRAVQDETLRQSIAARQQEDFLAIHESLEPEFPGLRILISDLFWGESELYLAANSLHHAMEYYDFVSEKPTVARMDVEMQLHGAFVETFDVYRKLSNQAIEALTQPNCDEGALSASIADQVVGNCSASMESVHHHIQMFALTFTERLGSSGFVDSEYIHSRQIIRRCMGFETEAEFRSALLEIICDLRRQYLTLTAIGKQRQIQAVREYVLSNVSDCNLSVNELAARFSITPSQLTKQFRRYYGETLHTFIQDTRLKYAKELMRQHPDWSVYKIGEAAGYIDISTMYRAFQKKDGITPGVIKRRGLEPEK